jgi:DNA polymerase III delta prime subunit
MYDLRFRNPSTFILAGPSQSGKTTLALNLLRGIDEVFLQPECKNNIIYFYNQWQHGFESFKTENTVKEWVNKMPSTEDVLEKTLMYKDFGGSVAIVDDFQQQLSRDTIELFTRVSHHANVVIMLLMQNIFCKNPVFREISLNSTYNFLLKNPRDAAQISNYARQFAPGNTDYIVEAFKDATKQPYSYLLFDNHQLTPDILRVRSNVLPHEFPMRIYTPKNCAI